MNTRPYLIHALSPLHPGTGQAADVIDLPIARMKSTGMPFLPGSSVKGVLRDALSKNDKDTHLAVFGPEQGEGASEHAGAIVVGDARLLCLPIRSFRGTFAWVSSPLLLDLAQRDLIDRKKLPDAPDVASGKALVPSLDANTGSRNLLGKRVILEDIDLEAVANADIEGWAAYLSMLVSKNKPATFARRFVVVDDETMTFLWETGTQVDTRVRLDETTRTVATGALWTEESLPAETLLLGLLAAEKSRRKGKPTMSEVDVLDYALKEERSLQFGGKATVGRGRCRMLPVT